MQVSSIDVLGIREHILTQPSLLIASLSDEERYPEEVVTISFVTLITKQPGGVFLRNILNPLSLEEEETDDQAQLRGAIAEMG